MCIYVLFTNSNQIEWKILDINSGVEATGIATTNLPANTTLFTAEY
jgi:hypothetical protein